MTMIMSTAQGVAVKRRATEAIGCPFRRDHCARSTLAGVATMNDHSMFFRNPPCRFPIRIVPFAGGEPALHEAVPGGVITIA